MFKKPYVKATTQYYLHKISLKSRSPVRSPVRSVPAVSEWFPPPLPEPVEEKEEKKEEKEDYGLHLLIMKEELIKEYELAKQQIHKIEEKIKTFKEVASNFWEAGSKELNF
jgi:hypothetical protein